MHVTQEIVFQEVGRIVGGLRYLKRCLQADSLTCFTYWLFRASDISRGRGPGKFGHVREIPQETAKNREIPQKYIQIHVGKTYFILILAIRPVLFTPNVQIYLETSSLQRVNNVPKLPGVLDKCCEKLGTNHNVNSFNIRSFLQ